MFRAYVIAATIGLMLFSYAQYKGRPAFGAANESREKLVHGTGRLYHK